MRRWHIAATFALSALQACVAPSSSTVSTFEETPPPEAQTLSSQVQLREPSEEAVELFAARCEACHGRSGRGDAPDALLLPHRLSDWSDPVWQDGISNERLSELISVKPVMLGHPVLREIKDKPLVVSEIVRRVRSMRR